jgi:outer membrane receptor protein involved in Fe transport
MKILFTTMLFCSTLLIAKAQDASLKGKVTDKASAPIIAATVSLLSASDSSWVHSELTADNGSFTMSGLAPGKYLLDINALGYEQSKQALVLKSGMNDLAFTIEKQHTTLDEVTVTGKKSFIENGLGKTIVNVEGSGMATGANILDLMRKLPGITVDMNNNISMSGKQGVLVLINGKETYLSAEQLADYLRGMSADEVAQMELISQPSAKYDASGNAGIINIKLKKNRKEGLNGTENLTGTLGIYPAIFQNLQLNYHKNKLNLFSNLNYLNAIGWIRINRERNFYDPDNGALTGYNNSLMESKEHFSNDKLQLGADYDLTGKTTLGISVTGIYHPNHQSTWTDATIADNASNSTVYDHALVLNRFLRTNVIGNAYMKHEFSKESNLEVNLDYVGYKEHTYQSADNVVHDEQNNALPGLELQGDLPFSMSAYNVKADYATTFKKIKWEAGIKSSLVTVDNKAAYSVLQHNVWVPDTLRSNDFVYSEQTNAAYISAAKEIGKKWQVQAGLRAEQVNINTRQSVGAQQFSKNSTSLFPTAYVSYKADDNNQFELNYGRRIERPDYKKLNPFIYFIDQYNYSVGNPNLRPQFSNNLELKHSYKSVLVTNLHCSYTNDVMNRVVIPDASTKGTYRTDINLGITQSAGISVSYNKQLYHWFLLALASDAWFSKYAGKLLDEELKAEGGGCYVSIDTQFVYRKWTAEAYYGFSVARMDITTVGKPEHYVDVSLSRKLLDDTCILKLHVRDPFNLGRSVEYSAFDNTTSTADYKWQSQQLALSVNYNFGKATSKSKHDVEFDEMKRMN